MEDEDGGGGGGGGGGGALLVLMPVRYHQHPNLGKTSLKYINFCWVR